ECGCSRGGWRESVGKVGGVGVPATAGLDWRIELMVVAAAVKVASSEALGICTRTVPVSQLFPFEGKVIIPNRATVPELVRKVPIVDLIARSRVTQEAGQSSAKVPQVWVPPSTRQAGTVLSIGCGSEPDRPDTSLVLGLSCRAVKVLACVVCEIASGRTGSKL